MGMLIFQRKIQGWFCSIKEEWEIKSLKSATEIQKFLMDNMIGFRVSYISNLIHIHFEESLYCQKDFKTFNEVISKLMYYKEKFGDFKNIEDLKKNKFGGK